MRIRDVYWTPAVNKLVIQCECGYQHAHRADRWRVRCPKCHRQENLAIIRERYVAEPR